MFRTLLLFCALAPLALSQPISFSRPATIVSGSAGACGYCFVVADFNGDGNADIAVNAMAPADQNGVFLGNGDGTFRPILPFARGGDSNLATGDFNGDGRPDLLFGGTPSQIELGNGDGTFGQPIAVPSCGDTSAGPVADFNGDGKSDILCAMIPLLSNGDGTFRVMGPVGDEAMENAPMVADFNHDGIPDILIRQLSSRVAIVLGRGDGTFGSELPADYAQNPQQGQPMLAGDFNGDGKVDLLTFSLHGNLPGNSIDLLPGKGDGTFGALIQTDISASPQLQQVTLAGDFNHDGKLDFIAGNSLYAGSGDGTFRFPVFFGFTAVTSGNFDGDTLPDVITYSVENGRVEIDILRNDSPGEGFWTPGVSAATGTWPVAPGSIVTAYGVDLAPRTEIATTNPAPTMLGGIRVHVRDRNALFDRLAPLLYVSPTQINYILNSTGSFAWVDIERVDGSWTERGLVVPVEPFAAGFFEANYEATAGGYLTLYGTGFAAATTSKSTCSVGSAAVNAQVTYAGPQMQIAGLDQVNILLPPGLAGAGVQPVMCVFGDNKELQGASKPIQVTIH